MRWDEEDGSESYIADGAVRKVNSGDLLGDEGDGWMETRGVEVVDGGARWRTRR